MSVRDRMLRNIQELQFTAVDLQLFLDTHPDDANAFREFVQTSKRLKDATEEYEGIYGPLIGYGQGRVELEQGYLWLNDFPWEDLGGND